MNVVAIDFESKVRELQSRRVALSVALTTTGHTFTATMAMVKELRAVQAALDTLTPTVIETDGAVILSDEDLEVIDA